MERVCLETYFAGESLCCLAIMFNKLRSRSQQFLPSTIYQHSLASVELASWTSRAAAHRRGSSLPLPFCAALGPVEAAKKAEAFEGVQAAIIKLFQRNPLRENELGTLQESVRALSDAEAGPLIYEYYKDQLLKKGMVLLREKIKNDQGAELVEKLGETWDYFFMQILPTLQALMYPLADSSKDMDIRNTTLLEFRNIVVLKVGLRETVDTKKYEMPPNIRQMLLVLQGLHDPTFLSKEQLDLEKLVACVVVPFLGSRGLYHGGPEPVTKANYRPVLPLGPRAKPKITITVSDAAVADLDATAAINSRSPRLVRLDPHPHNTSVVTTVSSPSSLRKGGGGGGAGVGMGVGGLHEPSSSHGGVLNHRLKPVMEVLDVGRRHSIVGT
ncbi:proline-rich protein 5-like isoform X2 [Babylonia areolata]|uniref:proline-rich protein 5-like isoform X2 n=1 Tax=Babylonia areolata TaxID=304850 RepID=UPI003FD3A5A9